MIPIVRGIKSNENDQLAITLHICYQDACKVKIVVLTKSLR